MTVDIVRWARSLGNGAAVLTLMLATTAAVPTSFATAKAADTFSVTTAPRSLSEIAVKAYVWGYPLVKAAESSRLLLTAPRTAATDPTRPGAPLNSFWHSRDLVSPELPFAVGINNDTLYSLAWLDMNDGPFVLRTPDFGSRYYTFAMSHADTSTEESLGHRTDGGRLPPVFITPTGYIGPVPSGMRQVSAPQRYFHIAGRILVDGEKDVPTVRALQDGIRLNAWRDGREVPTATLPVPAQRPILPLGVAADDPLAFFHKLAQVLADWPLDDAPELVASFRRIGLSPGVFDARSLSPEVRNQLVRGLAEGQRLVDKKSRSLGFNAKGWSINYRGARFGQDILLRAGVAKDQIYVNVPEEALYPSGRSDSAGRPLDGRHRYRIHFAPASLPPVHAFWSVTAYTDAGRLVANPIRRYSIGDRTADLSKRADGSFDMVLAAKPPTNMAQGDNWLPVPSGPFYLMMRLYVPRPAVLDRTWLPPAIERQP